MVTNRGHRNIYILLHEVLIHTIVNALGPRCTSFEFPFSHIAVSFAQCVCLDRPLMITPLAFSNGYCLNQTNLSLQSTHCNQPPPQNFFADSTIISIQKEILFTLLRLK